MARRKKLRSKFWKKSPPAFRKTRNAPRGIHSLAADVWRPARQPHQASTLSGNRGDEPSHARRLRRVRIIARETILIDDDDTLWGKNVFFEKTIEKFLKLVEAFGYAVGYARHI